MSELEEIFKGIGDRLTQNPEKIKGMTASFQFDLAGEGGGLYHVEIKDGTPSVGTGALENPGVTISMSAADFQEMVAGRLNSTAAFMSGRLKLKGDMGLAMKLQSILL